MVTWHEFGADGRGIPTHVSAARALLAEYYYGIPHAGISINEMVPEGANYDPAAHVSFFANLERAAVDSACHSCWPEPCPPGAVGPCTNCGQSDGYGVHGGQSLDGLLAYTPAGGAPRGVWWAYKAYGALLGGALLAVNASGNADGVVAVSKDGQSLVAIVGLLSSAGGGACGPAAPSNASNSTQLIFQNAPAAVLGPHEATVDVAIAIVNNTGTSPLHAPLVSMRSVPVDPKTREVQVPIDLRPSEAALVVVGKFAGSTVDHFAAAPTAGA